MNEIVDRVRDVLAPLLGPLEIPFRLVLEATGMSAQLWWFLVYDIIAIALVFVFFRWLVKKVFRFFKRDTLADRADVDAMVTKNQEFVKSLEAAKDLESTIGPLKKAKDWARLGEVHAALDRPKDAAKWFRKARDHKRSAQELAKAGQTVRAAKALLKSGDFETAGRFFLEKGKFVAAAKAFSRHGDMARAADAYGQGGKFKEAFALFTEYFRGPRDEQESQITAAESCYILLKDEKAKAALSEEDQKTLFIATATVFEQDRRFELAAMLFRDGGDLVRAGEVYVLAGKLEDAVKCMQEAGRPKEAARIGGTFYEKNGRFREAGLAYAGAEEYFRAGECFAKAKEPVRAGECFAKAQAHFRAGFAYARAGRFEDAIAMLQKLPESDAEYSQSRALLGRCFYELHDYAHCAATLENHLLGKRVEKANIDYFYMLALALEQLGKLNESRDILYKIGAVRKEYRDLSERISNIDSRISMLGDSSSVPPGQAPPGQQAASKIMEMVENSLGDRYTFERELGRGGMGVVYLAKDRQLERQVALKFLGSLVDGSEEYKQRFIREARTAAKISHPNIVNIYDIGASEGKAYIAMEYIEGPDLAAYLESKGKLTPREATNIMVQACGALGAIHDVGIVHRDIKPENIVIAKGGLVKLMDFGLAKAEDARLTKSNIIMGTPCYMSPEQAVGKDVDGRADLYAMGLVLHELLTGDMVFGDGDIIERQIQEIPPNPGSLVEGIPEALDAIVMKCIAKDPEQRFQTAQELVGELRKVSQ